MAETTKILARWAEPDVPIELLYVPNLLRDDDVPVSPAGYWYPLPDDDEYGFVLVVADALS